MTTSWMKTTIARENDTSTAFTPEDNSSWRPLAIALPVCLVGIPLVTVIVIVLITCYRSKFRHKTISIFGRKLNDESGDQNEAAEIGREAGGNRTETPASLTSVYANLSETVEEASRKEEMGNNSSHRNGIAKSFHWPLKVPWKKRQLVEAVNITANTEAEKVPTTDVTDHKERRRLDKAEEKEEEARVMDGASSTGTGMERTPGRTTVETIGIGDLLKPKANGQAVGIHGVPLRQKNETTTKNQNTDNATTTTTTKPSQTDNRKTFVVMYPMDSHETNHLSLDVNDVIFFMDEEKDGWLKVEKKETGEVGWFPRTHVREGMSPLVKRHSMHAKADALLSETNNKTTTATTALRATMATMTTTQQQCDNDNDAFEDFDDDDDDDDDYETEIEYQALYPYRATEDGDINFDAGDVIVVVEKQDNGWWRGYHGDDHGFFPGSYVQILRTDESSQLQATGVSGGAAGDAGQLGDPEMLLTLAEEDEIEDDDDALQQKQNKNKKKNSRRSIGVFLMSLPGRLAATPGRAGNDTGHGGGSSVVTSDPHDPIKTKKPDRIVIPGVKKTKNKNKNKKTKNDRNLVPMARRSSLAPAPPQSALQGATVGALVKNVMSGLAQMVAAEAQLRNDPLNTTYEEIGTTDLSSPSRLEFNPSEGNEIIEYEIVATPVNSSDVMAGGKSSTSASLVFGAKRNDVSSSSSTQMTAGVYSNLDSAVQSAAAAAKDISNRRGGQETKRTEDNKQQGEIKNKEQSKQMMGTEKGPSSRKPVPPQKPSYSGSTPNIAALLSAMDSRTDGGARRLPGNNKPRPLAKPGRTNPGGGRGSDLGLTGAELRRVLPPLQKPKPLKEKPLYLSPGFPQGVAPKSDQPMQRRDIYRSLDSILVAAEAEDGTTDEDEAGAGELEIMKWLRRKLSAEDELISRGAEVVGRADGGSQLTGAGKESQQIQMGRTKDISDGTTQNVEQKDGTRIVLMFESLNKAGLNEESFV